MRGSGRRLAAGLLALAAAMMSGFEAAPAAGKREIALADVFPTPAPAPASSFQWSPDGSALAWLQAAGPGKDALLRLRRVPGGEDVALTREEEGPFKAPISSFTWSPDGDALAAVSGGDLLLFDVPARRAEPAPFRRLTQTPEHEGDPKFSPDGRWIGFTRDGDLHVIDPATGRERRLTRREADDILNGVIDWVYEEEFAISSGWWWSPDSRRVAYLQLDQREVPRYPIVDWSAVHPAVTWQRYPKAGDPNPIPRVGVVDLPGAEDAGPGTPATRWLDLGPERDLYLPRAGWSTNGLVAVQRLSRDQKRLELMLCDPSAGSCRILLTETDPHWINIGDDWAFLGGKGRPPVLVWGSERDGYRHLYLYDLEGRLERRITSGPWIVTDLEDAAPAEGTLHFTANEKDPRERHLYRVRLDGGPPQRVTREEGWHDAVVAPGGKAFVDTWSTPLSPPSVSLRDAGGAALAVLDDAEMRRVAELRLANVEFHDVPARDGTMLPAMLMKPESFDPSRRYPVLVHVYGGPHAQLATRSWMGWRALWHHMMADQGVLIWVLDNRGAAGRGHAWETPVHRRMGRQELSDQLDGAAWLRTRPWVDPARLGIWGWSYGGYMTLYALANAPGEFRMGVSVAPVTDWAYYDTIYTERYMERPSDNEDGYRDSAPLRRAAGIRDALLLVHGTADDNVHMQNSVQLLDALASAGRPVEFMLYPGKGHGIAGSGTRRHLFEKITGFVRERL